MKTGKILLALLFVAASGVSAFSAAGEPKSDAELARHLKSRMKCESGKNPACTLKYRGLEIEFSDMKNPAGGTMAVIDIGPARKYANYGNRCILIEFMDRDLLFRGAAAGGTGIIFRDDGTIMPQFENSEADALCK